MDTLTEGLSINNPPPDIGSSTEVLRTDREKQDEQGNREMERNEDD